MAELQEKEEAPVGVGSVQLPEEVNRAHLAIDERFGLPRSRQVLLGLALIRDHVARTGALPALPEGESFNGRAGA